MAWQKAAGYNWRALVEADISRFKRVIGNGLRFPHRSLARDDRGRDCRERTEPDAGTRTSRVRPPPVITRQMAGLRLPSDPCNKVGRSYCLVEGAYPEHSRRGDDAETLGRVATGVPLRTSADQPGTQTPGSGVALAYRLPAERAWWITSTPRRRPSWSKLVGFFSSCNHHA